MSLGPTHLYQGDLLFVHAGVHPSEDIPDFLAQDRFDFHKEDHWASIRYPFLNWQGGWDHADTCANRRDRRPTVIVHGHKPALRKDLSATDELLICDGVDEHRAIDLDIGAAYRPQIAWAHFRSGDGNAQVQIHGLAKVNN